MGDKPSNEMTTEERISWIYNDKMGFQSLQNLWSDVRKRLPEISYDSFQNWYSNNTNQKMVLRGHNSFVAGRPCEDWEVAFLFVNDKDYDEYKIRLAGIDVFSRFGSCFALTNKTPEPVSYTHLTLPTKA